MKEQKLMEKLKETHLFDSAEAAEKMQEENKQSVSIENKFINIEKEWVETLSEIGKKIKDFDTLSLIQSQLFSYREILIEKRNYVYFQLIKIEAKLREEREKELKDIYYSGNEVTMKSYSNITIVIESRLSNRIKNRDILKAHFEFFDKSIDTIDKMLFGVKNRIQIEEIKNKFL